MRISLCERQLAAAALFGAGLAAGLGQVVLVRELLNIAAGNELTIGIMLAGWFLWGAAGAGIVGRLAARDVSLERSTRRVFWLSLLPFFVLSVSIALARMTPLLLSKLPAGIGAQFGEVMGLPQLVVVSAVVVLGAGLLAGAQFAAGLKLYTQLNADPRAVGLGYAFDALGHLTGGVLAALLLVWGYGAQTMALVGGLAAFWTGASLNPLGPAPALRRRPRVLFFLVYAIGVSLGMYSLAHSRCPQAIEFRYPLLTERESPYGSWAVTNFGQSGAYFHLDGSPVGCSPATPGIQYLVHFPLLQLALPRVSRGEHRLLLIGGGANGALAQVLQYPVTVDYAELDPALISLVKQYSVGEDRAALSDARVVTHATDGRRWLKVAAARQQAYDAVLLAVPDPSTAQVNRFYTVEFFRQVAALLKPEGVLGLQIPSSDTYFGDELLCLNAVLVRTVQSVFPQVALLPGDPMVIAASPTGRLTEDPARLRARYDRLGLKAMDFRAHVADRLFPFTVRQVREDLERAPRMALNTDERPIGYFYGQAYWVAQHSRGSWAVFRWIAGQKLWRLACALGGLTVLLAGVLAVWRRGRGLTVPLAIFGTGAIGMMLELVLLFAFQVSYGYVYQLLGILTGAFMVGLAAGGIGGAGLAACSDARRSTRLLCAVQLVLAVIALAVPVALRLLDRLPSTAATGVLVPYLIFPLLMAIVGLAVGAEFPLAARSLAGERTEAQSGALIYAADLSGAALGALVAGAALVPVLGLADTCALAAVLSAALAGLLALRR